MKKWKTCLRWLRQSIRILPGIAVVIFVVVLLATEKVPAYPVNTKVFPHPAVQKEEPTTEAVKKVARKHRKQKTGPFAVPDGVYEGSGTGYGGTIRAAVSIQKGNLKKITILSAAGEDAAFFNRAKTIVPTILKKQNFSVDGVSGATYSSNGIKEAVKSAMLKAYGITVPNQNAEETQEKAAAPGKLPYADGIYYGTGKGYRGDITVAIVIQNKTLLTAMVTQKEDDEPYFTRASRILKTVVKKQSRSADAVSGATYSSRGILQGIEKAFAQAKKEGSATKKQTKKKNTKTRTRTKRKKTAKQKKSSLPVKDPAKNTADSKKQEPDAAEKSPKTTQEAQETTQEPAATTEETKDTGSVYQSGTYYATAVCNPDADMDFDPYTIGLNVTIDQDRVKAITNVKGVGADYDKTNDYYLRKAANGSGKYIGIVAQLIAAGNASKIDAVSGATCSSKAIQSACANALLQAKKK